jgi:D-arabinose 1-dehydrogenase-like Zn-dependent alcohol dehydrogenase
VTGTMRAARMHRVGEPMILEDVPRPPATGSDVVVRVEACNIVPNLANILANWTTWFPQNPLPALPAIFGLDPAGVVDEVGEDVHGFAPGDRVYVNPGRYCGSCPACRRGEHIDCESFAFAGYFGFTASATRLLDRYPYGGLAEYLLAPAYSLVRLPESIDFRHGARFGYLGTAYSALRKAKAGADTTLLINGISGTLGLGPGAPHDGLIQGMASLRRGGRAVNIGATAGMVPFDVHHMMDQQLTFQGSIWFTAGEGQQMAELADSGLLDLSVLENVVFPLGKVNEAISGIENRRGGFSNFIVSPAAG